MKKPARRKPYRIKPVLRALPSSLSGLLKRAVADARRKDGRASWNAYLEAADILAAAGL